MNREETILFCAFRYALGRQTYIVGEVADEIKQRLWEFGISDGTKARMREEIEEAIALGKAGAEIDVREWQSVLAQLEK